MTVVCHNDFDEIISSNSKSVVSAWKYELLLLLMCYSSLSKWARWNWKATTTTTPFCHPLRLYTHMHTYSIQKRERRQREMQIRRGPPFLLTDTGHKGEEEVGGHFSAHTNTSRVIQFLLLLVFFFLFLLSYSKCYVSFKLLSTITQSRRYSLVAWRGAGKRKKESSSNSSSWGSLGKKKKADLLLLFNV